MKKKPQKQNRPIPSTPIEEIKEELGVSIAVKTLHDSEGGQILIDNLIKDIFGAMESLMINVSTLSHIELVSLIAKMKERFDILKVMTEAKSRQEVYEDLLVEEIKKEKENPPKQVE